jgi:hypothetical protein
MGTGAQGARGVRLRGYAQPRPGNKKVKCFCYEIFHISFLLFPIFLPWNLKMETADGEVPLRQLPRSSNNLHAPEYSRHDSSAESDPRHDEELPSYTQVRSTGQILGRGHSTLLHRSAWVFAFTIIYVVLVVYAWAMTAVLSTRPFKDKSWAYSFGTSRSSYYYRYNEADFDQERNIYRSVRTIHTFIQLVTLPWISTVCASAAVIYAQNQKDPMGLRLRQVTTLADRRWMDFSFYPALIYKWRQYGSKLLATAIFICVFGLITFPIQSVFLSSQSVKVRTLPQEIATIYDFSPNSGYSSSSYDTGKDVLKVRNALNKANVDFYQPNLWSNNSGVQFLTLNDLSSQTYYSQVPSGFNTGLLRQFAPRVNSTATYEIVRASDFPVDCSSRPGAFYAEYSSSYPQYVNSTSSYSWGVTACMPGNMTRSPWQLARKARNRQDFSEVLYLNMTQEDYRTRDHQTLFQITVNTTAGFFELPNYMNKGVPGPLLDQDPAELCDQHCPSQFNTYYSGYRRDGITVEGALKAGSLGPISTDNKGPLLSAALASFGPGSFIDSFIATAATVKADDKVTDEVSSSLGKVCAANTPLTNLMGSSSLECVSVVIDSYGDYYYPVGSYIAQWINYFQDNAEPVQKAFTSAAFLANQEFLSSQRGRFSVAQDLGADMDLPSISPVGIIVVSILMALYLLPLLALSLYAGFSYRWTERLDSFVMLRFGAFVGDKFFPLLIGRESDKVPELDEMSGVIRDVATYSGDEVIKIGRLGFGEGSRLREGHRYECFQGNDEPLNHYESRRMQRVIHRRA